jgi:hypothetical protein
MGQVSEAPEPDILTRSELLEDIDYAIQKDTHCVVFSSCARSLHSQKKLICPHTPEEVSQIGISCSPKTRFACTPEQVSQTAVSSAPERDWSMFVYGGLLFQGVGSTYEACSSNLLCVLKGRGPCGKIKPTRYHIMSWHVKFTRGVRLCYLFKLSQMFSQNLKLN